MMQLAQSDINRSEMEAKVATVCTSTGVQASIAMPLLRLCLR